MFEAIYISLSCKQAVNFINDLAIKLKQRGIDNVDIDRKNIQLKSDKFIVSAVDIWGTNLGRDYRFVKYYIDRIFVSDYSNECEIRNALAKWRELKCRFRSETKEISEEELIEILTEVSTHD